MVFEIDSPKTGESRKVKLPFAAVQALIRIQEAQGDQEAAYSVTSHQAAWRQLDALCKEPGIPCLGPHCLRHTCASLALSQGVPITAVAKHLGHADPLITLKAYSHFMEEDEDRCTEALERALKPRLRKTPDNEAAQQVGNAA